MIGPLMKTLLVAAAALHLVPDPASAEDFPNKPITLIVPAKPGGGSDIVMRAVDKFTSGVFGHSFTFKFISGSGSRLGMKALADSPADGYTIAIHNFPNIVLEDLLDLGGYSIDDFEYLGRLVADPHALITRKESEIKTFENFVAAAKKSPGQLTVGVPQKYDGAEIGLMMMLDKAGVKAAVVPFQGGAPQKQAILGGHVAAGMVNLSNVSSILDEVNVLAVTDATKLERLPNVPTFKSLGVDVVHYQGRILMAPKGVPAPALKKLREGLKQIYDNPEFKVEMEKLGQPLNYLSGEDLEAEVRGNMDIYKDLLAKFAKPN